MKASLLAALLLASACDDSAPADRADYAGDWRITYQRAGCGGETHVAEPSIDVTVMGLGWGGSAGIRDISIDTSDTPVYFFVRHSNGEVHELLLIAPVGDVPASAQVRWMGRPIDGGDVCQMEYVDASSVTFDPV